MAATEFGLNHPLAVKKWSSELMREALKKTYAMKFMGKSQSNIIQIKNEVKDVGDKITFGLRMQLTGDGVSGDNTLEGNEEALDFYNDAVYIDQLRHAVRSKGKMSEQRVPYSMRNEARDALADWWADRIDSAFFNQICGNTAVTDVRYTGMQAATAPSSNRIIYAGSQDSEASLATTNTFNLTLIDYAVELACTNTRGEVPDLRPLKINGEDKYVMFLHPYQVTDLRTNTDTGQWLDIQKAAMMGGQVSKNPIYTGALGEYNGVILHKAHRIPSVVSNTRRAVLCGAQAASIAFGRESGQNTYSWVEEMFDFKNQLGVSAGSKWGLKKNVFNSEDFGTIVVSTYAAAHS